VAALAILAAVRSSDHRQRVRSSREPRPTLVVRTQGVRARDSRGAFHGRWSRRELAYELGAPRWPRRSCSSGERCPASTLNAPYSRPWRPARQKLDAPSAFRADFPVFDELVNGKPVAYWTRRRRPRSRAGARAMREFYEHSYANVHRVSTRSRARDGRYEEHARRCRVHHAPSHREVIFTRSATEAINLIAYSWASTTSVRGGVGFTSSEHHANFVRGSS